MWGNGNWSGDATFVTVEPPEEPESACDATGLAGGLMLWLVSPWWWRRRRLAGSEEPR